MSGWRLLVWDAPANDRALENMGLRPTKKNPRVLMARYAAGTKPQLLRHIEMLRERGLHGKAVRAGSRSSGRDAVPSPAAVAPTVARSDARALPGRGRRERKVDAPGLFGS